MHRIGLSPLWLSVFMVGLALVLTGCGSAPVAPADGRLQVVATIGQVADVARVVGGEHVTVTGLMGPGVDPHLYAASEGDVGRLQEADIIFYNGLFLEAQMAEVLEQLGTRKTVVAVAEAIDPARLLPWAEYADQYDPHVWFDVTLWMEVVDAVRDAYIAADPDNADAYRANADAYRADLEDLHAYALAQAATIPAEQRVLVTAHDAFHYFGRAYGFEVRGLQGISTASEAGANDVSQLADFIVTRQLPAIFVESSVPVRTVEALQAAVAAQGFEVAIGGELFSDALGDAESGGDTYIGMVRHNIDTIVTAFTAGLRGE